MSILLLDHQDSFTYNLAQVLAELEYVSFQIKPSEFWESSFLYQITGVILSPGPMTPTDHPGLWKCLSECINQNIPVLGICLGHQGIGEYFGARLKRLPKVVHGRQKLIEVDNSSKLFQGLPKKLEVGLYHSWILDLNSLPERLQLIGISDDQEVMGIKHAQYDIYGIQFHPESFLTPLGQKIIQNFIMNCK